MMKNHIIGDYQFLATSPSAPQDLVKISLKITNMQSY